jgi:SAM-dependent methyltransferase
VTSEHLDRTQTTEVVQPWQLRKGRNTIAKLDVIRDALNEAGTISSVLDIGCNAGVIARGLGDSGFFCVGIDKDVNTKGVADPLRNACLGQTTFNRDLIKKLPVFDAALVLSVHHHFFRDFGDEQTRALFSALRSKVRQKIMVEVSSKNKEYGHAPGELFIDGDEQSVTNFTKTWLEDALPGWEATYVWMNKRRPRLSDRYLFSCAPKIPPP